MAGERGSVRKNNRRHLSCIAVFYVCECQLVFSVGNKFVFDHDKYDVQGVVDYEYNGYVPLHQAHIPE